MSDFPDDPSIIELTAELASDLTAITTGLQMAKTALEQGSKDQIPEQLMATLVGVGFAMADSACKSATTKLAVVGSIARIRELDYGDADAMEQARKALPLLKQFLKPKYYAAVREHVNVKPDGSPINA